jgi:predicted ferric reductase
VALSASLVLGLVGAAIALSLSVRSVFAGPTKHKRYRVDLVPQCFTTGCTKATTLAVQVTIGNAKHPAAKCAYGTFQLPNAKVRRDGRFSVSGSASTVSRTFTLKVSGVFTSSMKVRGLVVGPKFCGSKDSFRLSASKAAG